MYPDGELTVLAATSARGRGRRGHGHCAQFRHRAPSSAGYIRSSSDPSDAVNAIREWIPTSRSSTEFSDSSSVGQRLHKRPQSAFRVAGAVLAVAVGLVCGWVENLGAFVVRVAVMVIDIVDDDRGGSCRGTVGFR